MKLAKIKKSLFPEIRGSVKNDTTFRTYGDKRKLILSSKTTHGYTRTEKQDNVRKAYARLRWLWKHADWIDKTPYEIIAIENRISAWNAFVMHHMPIMSKNPVLYIPMIEGQGSTAHDLTLYGNDGTIYGATWKKSNKGLNYLYFDGQDDYIDVENQKGKKWDETTIMIIVKLGNKQSVYISKTSITTNYARYMLYWNHNLYPNKIRFEVYDGSNTNYFNTPNTYSAGETHFITDILTPTYGKIYVDGELKAQQNKDINTSVLDGNVYIAATYDKSFFAEGSIYYVAIYNTILTDAEIKQIYDSITKFYRLAGIHI